MKKIIIGSLALIAGAGTILAGIPMTESTVTSASNFQGFPSPLMRSAAKAPAGSFNTWTEDFEGRPDNPAWSMQEWLPDGWQDVSKKGNVAPAAAGETWNLTWQVTTNEYVTLHNPSTRAQAYQGEAFAYIINDVAYDGHYDLVEQDEWLITPAVTPTGDDWLYFKLVYNAGWTVVNNSSSDNDYEFTGQNNSLQVYASTDNGATWTKVWDLIEDEIKPNYTDEQLRESLIDLNMTYHPIYVNIKNYLNKSTKFAFRYFGKSGQPMAIDNVAVGVPQPVAKYEAPDEVFYEAITADFDFPTDPKLLIPYDTEFSWINKSTDILVNEWTYSDASGATTTSTSKNLTTPAYPWLTTADTPSLIGSFEQRVSEPFSLKHKKMQAGGYIMGATGKEATVGTYDVMNTSGGKLKFFNRARPVFTLCSTIDLEWEAILGRENDALDILGLGVVLPKTSIPYGFDFADVGVIVREKIADDARLELRAVTIGQDGYPEHLIGVAELFGKDIQAEADDQIVLRFKFPVPVYADTDVMLVLSGLREENSGAIDLPYVSSDDPDVKTKSIVVINEFNSQLGTSNEWYGDLSTLPFDNGYFGGHLISIGATYSKMSAEGDLSIDAPLEGATGELKVTSFMPPERWALTIDGVTPADWAEIESAEYDDATSTYNVKIKILPNTKPAKIDDDLLLASPGSYVTIHVTQPGAPSGIDAVTAEDAVSVKTTGDFIEVIGGTTAEIYTVSGQLAAKAALNGSKTVIDASGLAKGVYIVRIDGVTATKIVL